MRPPRLARRILHRALPIDVRDDILQILDDQFAERLAAGRARARAWYWRETLSFSAHFSVERLRGLRHAITGSDLKLALRMLVRYPVLTLVSTLGMAVGITIAAGMLSILHTMTSSRLPFPDGDRIVAIQNFDRERRQTERRVLHDFARWRAASASVRDVAAFRRVERNLIEPRRAPETVRVAEMTASGFRVTGVQPIMGRTLQETDEVPSAAPAVVIGETFWRTKLDATPGIIGRTLQLAGVRYIVVGVMPASYEFPVRDQIWIPWSLDAASADPASGPGISVFGRLAPGATLDAAQAEFAALSRQAAAAFPGTHRHVEAQVVPYTHPFTDMDDPDNALAMHLIRVLVLMLLAIICVNVAILVYARTARRQSEIAVRTVLGAARRRIVAQLFVEALALAGCAAAIGLMLASAGLRMVDESMEMLAGTQMPFWLRFGLSPRVVLYVVALTMMAAAIVGIVPALKATGRRVQSGLKAMTAGGGAGMQLGRLWTWLIVAQVAFAVALLPAAIYHAWYAGAHAIAEPGDEARQIVLAELSMDRSALAGDSGTDAAQQAGRLYAARHAALMRALAEEPGVTAVTFSLTHPGAEGMMFVELEGVAPPAEGGNYSIDEGSAMGHLSRFTRVDPGYFEAYGVEQLAGRRLGAADSAAAASTVVVSRTFAERFFGGNALGRRVRYVGRGGDAEPGYVDLGRWYEIVGVVSDFPAHASSDPSMRTRIYHAAAPGTLTPAVLTIHLPGGAPSSFPARLREIAGAIDPNLQLRRVTTLAQSLASEQGLWRLIATVLGGVTLAVVLLSAAGIYAMMSFTVAQRRREIGIRSALGADPRQILMGIFGRAARQLSSGAACGIVLAMLFETASQGDLIGGQSVVVLPIVAAFMTIVGLAAAYVPARQGLRIHPTEALRGD